MNDEESLRATAQSKVSGWSAAVGVPVSLAQEQMRAILRQWGGVALLAIILALSLGLIFGRALTNPLTAISAAAAALGRGERFQIFPTRLKEVNSLGQALLSAGREIAARAEAKTRESEQRFRQMQMELAHANRIATLGQLTASIAHEVNQPLAAVIMNAGTALRWLDAQPANPQEARKALIRIADDGNRAAEVIRRIRELSKKAPPREDQLEINGAIHEVIEFTRAEAAENQVRVQVQLADGLPLIRINRVHLQQVLLNLIINAIDAMNDNAEGARELLITTTKAEDGSVLVTVRDSGPGLAPAVRERLFEAFYTTKTNGLGLGLSICRSIIEEYGGRLWASADTPRGAAFHFTAMPIEDTLMARSS